MSKYLIDTNICIYYQKGFFGLNTKFREVGSENCFISEITLAELKYGVENSTHPLKNQRVLDAFISGFEILPIYKAIDIYAKEKSRLKKAGNRIDDFDLLIGATAIAFNLILVTNNTRHFERMKGIKLENWVAE